MSDWEALQRDAMQREAMQRDAAQTTAHDPEHPHGVHARARDIRRTMIVTALGLAALAVVATVSVYLVPQAWIATVLAWVAVALSSAAAVLGMVMAVIGPRRVLAVVAIVIGLLANPLVLWSLVSAAGDLSPY